MNRDQRIAQTREFADQFRGLARTNTDLAGWIMLKTGLSERRARTRLREAGIWPAGPYGAPAGYAPTLDPVSGRWMLGAPIAKEGGK